MSSDMNLSTTDAINVRFKSQTASMSFIKRLNAYLHKCYLKQRDWETPCC